MTLSTLYTHILYMHTLHRHTDTNRDTDTHRDTETQRHRDTERQGKSFDFKLDLQEEMGSGARVWVGDRRSRFGPTSHR